jgi:ribonuclease BN (tRNA processing enzyme)
MRLTVVGSADAFNSAGRGHSCFLLEADGCGVTMIDFGATALRGLKRLGRSGLELDGIVLTHLHGDHAGGFPFLLIDAMYNHVRGDGLEILGPPLSAQRLDAFARVAYGELVDNPRPFDLHVDELEPGNESSFLGWTVRAFRAEHMDPPDQALCLQVQAPGSAKITFSGDTAMCEGLLEASRDADLLVAECTAMRQPAGRHCTWEEWEKTLPTMNVPRVLFTHLNDEVRSETATLKTRVPGVEIEFADDGMVLEL